MTAFADLVLPDTTYLERHDVMSMLDRPISEFDGPVDAVRIPVLPPTGECKPFQEVLIELGEPAAAAGLRAPRRQRASTATIRTSSSTTRPSRARASASCPAGAARAARSSCVGEPNPRQWEMYAQNNCVYHHELPPSYQYMRNWNKGYLDVVAAQRASPRYAEPILIHLYSEVLQKFRLAAQGKGISRKPPAHLRKRIARVLRSAALLLRAARGAAHRPRRATRSHAVTQRPMAMYHSWDSQNAWLRQIHATTTCS